MSDTLEIQEGLVVRPGDKLLVRVHRNTRPEQVQEFATQLKERLPEVEVCVIAADQLAVVRDDI